MTRTVYERPGPSVCAANDRQAEPPGFASAYPGYRSTELLDRLRATEYSYLTVPDPRWHPPQTGPLLARRGRGLGRAYRARVSLHRQPGSASPSSFSPG